MDQVTHVFAKDYITRLHGEVKAALGDQACQLWVSIRGIEHVDGRWETKLEATWETPAGFAGATGKTPELLVEAVKQKMGVKP